MMINTQFYNSTSEHQPPPGLSLSMPFHCSKANDGKMDFTPQSRTSVGKVDQVSWKKPDFSSQYRTSGGKVDPYPNDIHPRIHSYTNFETTHPQPSHTIYLYFLTTPTVTQYQITLPAQLRYNFSPCLNEYHNVIRPNTCPACSQFLNHNTNHYFSAQ